MSNIQTTILTIHTLIALAIIGLVLIQRGKGAEAGAAFGAGASGTVFGARGSGSFFSRATAVLATAFFATSLTLAFLSSQRADAPESVLESAPAVQTDQPAQQAPAASEPAGGQLPTLDEITPAAGDSGMPALDADAPAAEPPAEAGDDQ